MCGFTGFYELKTTRTRSEMRVIAQRMNDTLIHRGPDHGDIWQDKDVPLTLAHRRLSILDLSEHGNQPMTSHSGQYVIAFNGEIYNHLELRESLNVEFKGRSDTETLLAAIEEWGLNVTLQKIRGMFAFVLWDRKARTLHCVRDRFGKKPLYIGWAGRSLFFASELKAIRAHPDFKPVINTHAHALYIRYSSIPAPHTIYEGVWQIPAGHRFSIEMGTLDKGAKLSEDMQSFYAVQTIAKDAKMHLKNAPQSAIIDEFETLLTNSVKDRMLSDVPLGAFLSGGIDSALIVSLMQKISADPIQTYTIGFENADYNEADDAAAVAAHLGTDHYAHICTAKDAQDIIPKLPDIHDEPFADQSAIPTYLVSQFARKSVSVVLSGDGGDEVFGGYTRHINGPKIWNAMRPIPRPLRNIIGKSIKAIPQERWQTLRKSNPDFGAHMHKAASILSLKTQQDIYTRLLSTCEMLPTLAHKNAKFGPRELPQILGFDFTDHIMLWDMMTYLPHDILTKVDRASMAHSLEARAPLLDHRVFEFAWGLPMEYKIRQGRGKWILRETLKRHIPETLFDRPKHGFNIPIGEWLKDPLKEWAADLLNPKTLKEQGIYDPVAVTQLWDDHLAGTSDHSETIWGILMFQAWHARWM